MTGPALGLLAAPLVWLYGLVLAIATTLVDVVATPLVWWARRRATWPDEPPATRNASVIVLNYNGVELLGEVLPSLEVAVAAAPGEHEILLVDNGSTDGSVAYVEARHPGARLIRLPENRFFIRGNEAGVAAARGDVLVFVNNDMRVEPQFLVHLLERFDRGDVFAVTARIEMAGDRVETGRTRGAFRRGAFHFVHVDGPTADAIPALWAGGGSSAFDRAKLQSIGGFERLYDPCYVEDVSLSYQAWRRGWRVLYEPRSVAHHRHRTTSVKVLGAATVERLDRRNRELFFWRSVTDPAMVWQHALWLPWNLQKDLGRTGAPAQLAALFSALPRLPAAWRARQRTRVLTRRGDRAVLRVANHVRRHRAVAPPGTARPPVVLSLGTHAAGAEVAPDLRLEAHQITVTPRSEPPDQDLLGLVPQCWWHVVGNAAVADAIRDLLCEIDHDVVLFRDLATLAATPPDLIDATAIVAVQPPSPAPSRVERWREQRAAAILLRRAGAAVYASDTDRAFLRAAAPKLQSVAIDLAAPAALWSLCRAVAGDRR